MTDPVAIDERLLAQAAKLLDAARARNETVTAAESCTGGLVAATLTAIPGASDVFERGFVTYSNSAKSELLGVPFWLIERHGAVSDDVARAMAGGALLHSHASLAVAVTGIAGPDGGSDEKPVGLVCFAAGRRDEAMRSECVQFGDRGRTEIRRLSVERALGLLLSLL